MPNPSTREGLHVSRLEFRHQIFAVADCGASVALIWVNIDANSYHDFVEFVLMDHTLIGHLHAVRRPHNPRTLTLHYLVNDVLDGAVLRHRREGGLGGA